MVQSRRGGGGRRGAPLDRMQGMIARSAKRQATQQAAPAPTGPQLAPAVATSFGDAMRNAQSQAGAMSTSLRSNNVAQTPVAPLPPAVQSPGVTAEAQPVVGAIGTDAPPPVDQGVASSALDRQRSDNQQFASGRLGSMQLR